MINPKLLRILFFSILIIGIFAVFLGFNKKTHPKYNLILISVDTLRADHMGVYGYKKNTTPNIDRWAKDATVLTNVRAQVPVTFPSFATIMTGKTAFDLGIYANTLDIHERKIVEKVPHISEDAETLAEILQAKGYDTSAFISNPVLFPGYTNMSRGFETYEYISYFLGRDNYEDFIINSLSDIDPNDNRPFFRWIHLMDPHAPYTPNINFLCKLNNKYCDRITETTVPSINKELERIQGCTDEDQLNEDIELYKTLYDGTVASSDFLVGKIIDEIKNKGLEKNTVVVFYGDHGEGFDHGYYFKHGEVLYDSALRIPFIIKTPAVDKGQVIDSQIDNTKIFDILLSTLNQRSTSFNRYANGDEKQYYATSSLNKFAVRDGNLKYIYSFPGACLMSNQTEELYDLSKDPMEANNLASVKPDDTEKLRKDLLNYINRFGLPGNIERGNDSKDEQEKLKEIKNLGY